MARVFCVFASPPPMVIISEMQLRPLIALCAFLAFNLSAAEPTASEIIAAARLNPMGNEIALDAQLRAGSVKVPFILAVRNNSVVYTFSNPDQSITLTMEGDGSQLRESRSGVTELIPSTRLSESVRGGLITYEDLSLGFLHWPNPKLLGEETVRTRSAWKIEIPAPPGSSQYGVVRVWVDKASAALLRIEGFDNSGKPSKRFEVVSARKLDGQWMLKQMRVERIDPSTRKTTGITYLEVLGKANSE